MWGMSLDVWNNLIVIFGVLGGAFALLAGGATYVALQLQKQEAHTAKEEFDKYKLGVASQVATAENRGIAAGEKAAGAMAQAESAKADLAKANQKIAEANAIAAKAEAKAAEANLARARLEAKLGPRTITSEAIAALAAALAPFKGRKVLVSDVDANTEGKEFATSLRTALVKAGLNAQKGSSIMSIGGGGRPPLALNIPAGQESFAEALAQSLIASGLAEKPIPGSNSAAPDLEIAVSSKVFR